MIRTKSLFKIGCAWFMLLALSGLTAWSQQVDPAEKQATAQEETETSKWLHGILFSEISAYDFYLDAEKQQKLVMRREPVFRYPAPTDSWGELYVWTDQGKPEVVACVWGGKRPDSTRWIFHEFHSLCPKPLATIGGVTGWQPEEEGLKFSPVPDSVEPAKDKAERLAQMRDIASHFSASMITSLGMEEDLPLQPEPIYRYELINNDSSVVDGALFAFVAPKPKDPEVLLVVEAQRKNNQIRWHYAPCRFTNRQAWLKHKEQEVWRVDAGSTGIFDGVTTKRYGVFFVKKIPDHPIEP